MNLRIKCNDVTTDHYIDMVKKTIKSIGKLSDD